MCGIFALLNRKDTITHDYIVEQFNKSKSRGPDNSYIDVINNNIVGFHRLSINGLSEDSNQPFNINNIVLICNGEIYNYKELFANIKYKQTTNSDCEVIIYLYMLYGIEYTLNILDGVFAFVLIDNNTNNIYVSRDPYGVRPMFFLYNRMEVINESINDKNNLIGFASEMKQLIEFTKDNNLHIEHVTPGEYISLKLSEENKWYINNKVKYTGFKLNNTLSYVNNNISNMDLILNNIREKFCAAVKKRVLTTDRPVACLLSGGLDSSIVCSLVKQYYKNTLETYSIGLEGSEDLKYARKVATFLDTKHTEIIVSEEDFFNQIPEVIQNIESYDTTTIRASVGNYLVAKYISENSEAKVIFNGDGSDELMGGYLYINSAPDHLEFDKECKRLLTDIHCFDVLRSDRSISSNGLEARTPFLDREFVDMYLSIPSNIRYNTNKRQEKYLFRKAFDNNKYLPKEIIWRKKEAFSDGVSSQKKSWYEIIQEHVEKQNVVEYKLDTQYIHNSPQTLEQLYYRTIFEIFYPNSSHIIPYFWMPKYVNAEDSSARSLDIYSKKIDEKYNNTINEKNI
jgi:asparagine synthase (glutamine-hydrolysing)